MTKHRVLLVVFVSFLFSLVMMSLIYNLLHEQTTPPLNPPFTMQAIHIQAKRSRMIKKKKIEKERDEMMMMMMMIQKKGEVETDNNDKTIDNGDAMIATRNNDITTKTIQ